MQTLSQIRELLNQRALSPKHRLGQNFLHDHNQLRKLVHAADLAPGELVLEVGPGTGTLTETLLESGVHVVACEIDQDMAAIIADHVKPRFPDRLNVLNVDMLATKHRLNDAVMQHLDRPFKLVANLPYQIASPLISSLLIDHAPHASTVPCVGMFITVQHEAAQRMTSETGTKEYGVLSVLCQTLARLETIARLSPGCFWPSPKVDSAMIAIHPLDREPVLDRQAFGAFLQQVFSRRRKQLGTIFGRDRNWPENIDPSQRPEQLAPSDLVRLFNSVNQ